MAQNVPSRDDLHMNNKRISIIIIVTVILQFFAIGIFMGTSKVQDVTLATDNVSGCNDGWKITNSDGKVTEIASIPFYGESDANEVLVAERVITPNMCGKTLSFLSADKRLQIFVDDKLIYSFGMDDKRIIGSTPGSVMVFADIPQDSKGKTLKIKMQSPYKDYASYMKEMLIGDRDVVILYFLKNEIFALVCCLGILTCGIILLIFATVQRKSKQGSTKLFSIGMYFIVLFVYHLIETKVPMIFYGNQVLYSNLIFLSLMMAPLFTELYLFSVSDSFRKMMQILTVITVTNIVVQITLQSFNILDFMDMAFVSHGLLTIVIIVVFAMEIENVRKRKKVDVAFLGILTVAICTTIDIIRCYMIKVGDLGMYSRVGAFVFGISMVIICINDMVKNQVKSAENAKAELISAEIIKTLVTAIDAKDIYTKGHSTRVAEYSVILAKRLGWDEHKIDSVRYKALLHDVGKIGIPDRVLNKADRLTDEEFDIIKSHTLIGSEILQGVSSLSEMHIVARNHHERYDGKGYPDKKSGEDIPEEARLVGIVDAYDAMSSDRAYRKALPRDVIHAEISRGRGTQFDPHMTDVFLELLDEGAFSNQQIDSDVKAELRDITTMLDELVTHNSEPGAIKIDQEDIGKVYQYISGLHERFGMDVHTVLISLAWEENVSMADVREAMKAMEYSILQSLRKVDVMTRVSESQYLIVLTEAHSENLQMIIDRVFASFFKNSQNTKIKPTYEIK